MGRLKNWTFDDLVKFLESYEFEFGYVNGSHHFYNGKIGGEERVVQAIFSKKERKCQSDKTMKMAVRHSSIPKKYFEEWKQGGKVYSEIIY